MEKAADSMSRLPSIIKTGDSVSEELAGPGQGQTVAKALEAGSWKDGDLHPAFRTWANCRRRRPVKKQDGSLPPLASQLDFGDARVVRRPVLLMAYVPEEVACEIQSARLPKIHRKAGFRAEGLRTAR